MLFNIFVNNIRKHQQLFLLVIIACFVPCSLSAESGFIVLGQSAALSGSSANLGLAMRNGLLAALGEINSKGGIKGHDLVLASKDDGYEPYRTIRNVNELIEVDDVFMLIGNVGTPTTEAILPVLKAKSMFLFSPYTGASSLRTVDNTSLIHTRASYAAELEKIVDYLVDEKNIRRIACFYQNDSYGLRNLSSLESILEKRDLKLVAKGFYERNTVAVLGALNRIHKNEPEAVIMIGSYLACAEFIKLSKIQKKGNLIYCNISFVGSSELKRILGDFGGQVVVSQVVPYLWNDKSLLARNYLSALQKLDSDLEPGFVSFEGYIAGRLFAAVASQVEGELSRERFYQTIQDKKYFEIDGTVYDLLSQADDSRKVVYLTTIYPEFDKVNK